MKGLKIDKAGPSNAIDIYGLLKQAVKDKVFTAHMPTEKQLEQYYFQKLISVELNSPQHFWLIAKRGRGFLGTLHAFLIPGRWDGSIDTMYVDLVYVTEKRRKMGIGQKLIDELFKVAENMGIKKLEFLAEGELSEYWESKRSAKKISNFMRVEL